MSATQTSMGTIEWILLLCLSLLWGGSFFFIGVAVDSFPPFTIVALRVSMAAAVLWLVIMLTGQRIPRGATIWSAFLVMGVLNNIIPFSLIVWGQTQIASGLASILNATTPIFTVLVAHLFTRDERLSFSKVVGVVAGFIGVLVMIGPDVLIGAEANVLAQCAVLVAAISYAFAGIYGRRFRTLGVSPMVVAWGQLMASSLLLIPLAGWLEMPWQNDNPASSAWMALIALALFSTALAYILYFRILQTAGATNLLLVTFLIPVSAILLGVNFLGEQLQTAQLIGMLIIATGLLFIDGRLFKSFGSSR